MPFRLPSLACVLMVLFPGVGTAQDPYVEGEVLVVFKPGFAAPATKAALAGHALKWDRQYGKISQHSGRVMGLVKNKKLGTAKLIGLLKADPNVESAEPNYLRQHCSAQPNDTEFPKLWGLQNTGQVLNFTAGTSGVDTNFLPAWWLARRTSAEVVVGVVDTGVDITHPDLAANIWTNPGEIPGNGIDDDGNGYTDDVHGYDFALGTAAMTDSGHHGTHVAGTIAATGRNHEGVIGAGYRAMLLPLKASDDGEFIDLAAELSAYDYAIDLKQHGVNIVAINASFEGTSIISSQQSAIAALRDNGIILCAAAGNGGLDDIGDNNDSVKIYPASYTLTNIIAVAAHTQTNTLASFSNYGATSVDLAAPGVNIYSTVSQSPGVTIGGVTHSARFLQYSAALHPSGLSGSVHDCGLGYPGDFPPAVSGNIALIERGDFTFAEKVTNAMNAGALAAIIYDNTADPLGGGWTLGSPGAWMPAVQVTQATGDAILAQLPASATLAIWQDSAPIYQYLNGTSMATPHVAGAVAFAAWNFPGETIAQRKARILTNVTTVPTFTTKMVSGGRLNLLKMIDTDSDGLPDWWEDENFGNLAEIATGDDDADGFTNFDEFLAATDPEDPASHLSFTAFAAMEDGPQTHFMLSFPSVEDRDYQTEWSEALQSDSWQPLGAPVTGTGGILNVQDTDAIHAAARRFYRMSILPD